MTFPIGIGWWVTAHLTGMFNEFSSLSTTFNVEATHRIIRTINYDSTQLWKIQKCFEILKPLRDWERNGIVLTNEPVEIDVFSDETRLYRSVSSLKGVRVFCCWPTLSFSLRIRNFVKKHDFLSISAMSQRRLNCSYALTGIFNLSFLDKPSNSNFCDARRVFR